jgi:CRISPR-associated protein Cas5t
MKALRLKAFQETACYTKPFANKVTETYPLPPYATVKGMIHAVMKAKELIPFSLSIQGDYESMIIDYRKTYFFEGNKFNLPIVLDGLAVEIPEISHMTSMPLYTHMLYNVELVIHINAEEDILQKIYAAFKENDAHLSLGRQEDLLRIDDLAFVELETPDLFAGVSLKHSAYIPAEAIEVDERGKGIPYLLNWTYMIKNGLREWRRIPSVFLSKRTFVTDETFCQPVYQDDEGYIVIWNDK